MHAVEANQPVSTRDSSNVPTCASRFLFSPSQKLTTPSPPAVQAVGLSKGRCGKEHSAHSIVLDCWQGLHAPH